MKLKEFAQLDKYPYASESIRQEVAITSEALDSTIEAIQNDPTLNDEAKTLLKYQKGKEYTQKLTQSIQKSIQLRELESKKLKEQLKSVQLRKEPLKEEQKAVMGIVYNELKNGNIDIFAKRNDNLLKIALVLADSGLIEDIAPRIDMEYSSDVVEGIIAQHELMEFEKRLLDEIREYEVQGLNEEVALQIQSKTFKG